VTASTGAAGTRTDSTVQGIAGTVATAYARDIQRPGQAEGLDLDARRRNPTGEGIHNKMVLARIGGRGWAVVGSLNGGEVSSKLNREVSLKVASDEAYAYLADLFWYDWGPEIP
jgi:hypothetical protein